ncbi:MAG: ABC transporter permease subunit [Hydrotalea flava]|uniref:ABC transporter permease n=1 Tax=Hydrotalea lipotrueae TaxID=2803817 RepID=UPI00169BC857|nr:ABC transporter permease [Hydrotalea lipotrueae]MBY0348178.1 ABC transporter permease [Hydrotalea flava]NIM36012.1 ABC transporter permease subunit [Hydrotalea flava]NIM38859.1 ABC transporter permease subunit [Hydrotalea flava]NIN04049.1 ABC transporter permease subunit [Hydrotalea flava]NIN15754.1 ABC transporter permease subunit [Hydrotalea flava]
MAIFILKKSLYGMLVLLGVLLLVFTLFQGLGDPARLIMGQTADKATIQNIRKQLALDEPKWKQFLIYINDVSPLSIYPEKAIFQKNLNGFFIGGHYKVGIKLPYLGRSYQSRKTVTAILTEAFPNTILLTVAAILMAFLLGISLGVLAAVKKGSWIDTTTVFTSILGISVPSFFTGIVIAYLFGFLLSQYTGLHMLGSLYYIDPFKGKQLDLKNLILPAITLGIRPLAIFTQLTRSSLLNELQQDYIRTAYAKGLTRTKVLFVHALKNALNPIITAITGWFAELLAGAFFVEYIFGWNGIGKVTVDALEQLDFPVVMGSVLLTACFFIVMNILSDVLYAWIDPRVK